MEIMGYEGKKIYVRLNSDRYYTGLVLEVTYMGKDTSGIETYLITIKDKFGNLVSFSNKEIKFIEVEG
jgi:hypothetical protein